MKAFYTCIIVFSLLLFSPVSILAETVLKKDAVDFAFSLPEAQWKEKGPAFYACPNCDVRFIETEAGTGMMIHDQVVNRLTSIFPNYADPKKDPIFVVIGVFFPVGWEKDYQTDNYLPDRETQAQQDVGLQYVVAATPARGPSGYEGILYTITNSQGEE
ncbi:MAG: hypothetical protein NPIRA01_03890 [Nitrospirales bacterium]|nr:MAG: hypothetical protein NPIRA01_03890 [Nitrospirales bacterium]